MFYTSVRRKGNKILHRWVDGSNRMMDKVDFEPTLFVKTNKDTPWFTLREKIPVEPKRFDSISDAKEFEKQFDGIKPDVIHGVVDYDLMFIHENYSNDFQCDVSKVRVFFLDIEVDVPPDAGFPVATKAEHPINAITIYDSLKKKYYVFSTVSKNYKPLTDNALYVGVENEQQLFIALINWWEKNYPDILTGWNSEGFDIPYIVNRLTNVMGEEFAKRLSPWSTISTKRGLNAFGQEVIIYDLLGIECIDYIDLYKKFTIKNQESYKLGFIAEVELGETKVEFEGSLYELARNDPKLFLDYNWKDVDLLVRMEEKLNLVLLCVFYAHMMRVNFSDALGTVRPWTSKVMFELAKENVLIDAYHRTHAVEYGGGFVKDPIVGKYSWVVSYDFTSLYPHIMSGWNIGPETKLEFSEIPDLLKKYHKQNCVDTLRTGNLTREEVSCLVEHDICMAGNGQFYRRGPEGIMSRLVMGVFRARKAKKQEMLTYKKEKQHASEERVKELESLIRSADVMQGALKVAANSFYGAVANVHFPLFDVDNASAITLTGQAAIQYMSDGMSRYITKLTGVDRDFVIAVDTDSSYLDISEITKKVGIPNDPTEANVDIVTKFADSKMKDESIKLADEFHALTNTMWKALDFKREKVICGGIWVKKKRYFCKVYDSEGVRLAEPDLAITGLETNRSSTPKLIRDKLTDAFGVAIDKDENSLQEFVRSFREEFLKQSYEAVSFPRGVNDIEKYVDRQNTGKYKEKTPIHVRASILHNALVDRLGLQNKYQKIKSGDKIRFVMLKTPNPIQENVIGFIGKLPSEFGLDQYIDYDLMFSKTFEEPLQNAVRCIGWTTTKQSSLEDFF